MKIHLVIISALIIISGCNTIFDPCQEIWKDPVVLEATEYDFGDSISDKRLYITYVGEYDTRKIECKTTQDWLSTEMAGDSFVRKGIKYPIDLKVDRSKLDEGVNEGEVEILIERIRRFIKVKVNGTVNIVISPEKIFDLKTSDSQFDFNLYSLSGSRTVNISSPDSWVSVQPTKHYLLESDGVENQKTVSVNCHRSMLSPGKHQGKVFVQTEGGFQDVVEISLYVLKPDDQSVVCDDWIFSLAKSPYRDGNTKITLEVNVENATGFNKAIMFTGPKSFAVDADGNRYTSSDVDKLSIDKDECEVFTISFNKVPDSVNSFEMVCLDFGLSELVVFKNLVF